MEKYRIYDNWTDETVCFEEFENLEKAEDYIKKTFIRCWEYSAETYEDYRKKRDYCATMYGPLRVKALYGMEN